MASACYALAVSAHPIRILTLAGLLVGLLAGCSSARLAYDNADWLVVRYAENRVGLTEAQREQLREGMRQWLSWHRRERMPEYRGRLQWMVDAVADGLDPLEAHRFVGEVRAGYQMLVADLVPLAARTLADLETGQVERLAERFREDNEEFARDHVEPDHERRAEHRQQAWRRRIERWVGALEPAQREWLATRLAAMRDTSAEWLGYRRAQQERLIELLRGGADGAEVEGFLRGWLVERRGLEPELDEHYRRLPERLSAMLGELDAMLEPQQRRRFEERLAEYRDLASAAAEAL